MAPPLASDLEVSLDVNSLLHRYVSEGNLNGVRLVFLLYFAMLPVTKYFFNCASHFVTYPLHAENCLERLTKGKVATRYVLYLKHKTLMAKLLSILLVDGVVWNL